MRRKNPDIFALMFHPIVVYDSIYKGTNSCSEKVFFMERCLNVKITIIIIIVILITVLKDIYDNYNNDINKSNSDHNNNNNNENNRDDDVDYDKCVLIKITIT